MKSYSFRQGLKNLSPSNTHWTPDNDSTTPSEDSCQRRHGSIPHGKPWRSLRFAPRPAIIRVPTTGVAVYVLSLRLRTHTTWLRPQLLNLWTEPHSRVIHSQVLLFQEMIWTPKPKGIYFQFWGTRNLGRPKQYDIAGLYLSHPESAVYSSRNPRRKSSFCTASMSGRVGCSKWDASGNVGSKSLHLWCSSFKSGGSTPIPFKLAKRVVWKCFTSLDSQVFHLQLHGTSWNQTNKSRRATTIQRNSVEL